MISIFTIFGSKWTKKLAASYDAKNVTPSDYTLFFRIEPEQNKTFDAKIYNPDDADSRG